MSVAQRLQEIRTGFDRPFWVANVTEMFERLSYYAAFASLARYLHENITLPVDRAALLASFFGLVWFFAPFGGVIADRLGFRRALAAAYLILSVSYFLLGSLGAPWFAPLRRSMPLEVVVALVVAMPALGIAMLKPVIVGTTARASRENVRSIGYSIYYTMVNVGSACGPLVASWVRRHMSVDNVFIVAAASVFLMFFAVLLFFKEPRKAEGDHVGSMGEALANFGKVLANVRFMIFLVIFSGYWIVFWQEFITLPLYVTKYIAADADTESILAAGPITVITLTIAINYLTRKIPPLPAIAVGTLVSGLAWLILAMRPTTTMAVVTVVAVALGEIIQSPRYYEYISRLAPPGQQGTYMGFAFLPIGLGSLAAGWLGGSLIHRYGEVQHRPTVIWWVVAGVGVLTAVLLFLYDWAAKAGAASRQSPEGRA